MEQIVKEYYLVMQLGSRESIKIYESYIDIFEFYTSFNIDDKLLLSVSHDNSYKIIHYNGDEKRVIKEDVTPETSHLIGKIIKRFKEISEVNKKFAFYEYEVTIDTEKKYHHKLVSYVNNGV
jgi:hypothetical protein